MNINILQGIDGAKNARGIAVIIDVFRAFSFECYSVHNNAAHIIPVADKDLAYSLKRIHPEYLLAGERHGRMLEGFDFGNSPSQIEKIDLTGKTLIHTTSAGTQGLENAVNAEEVITGSLVNARAIAAYICARKQPVVSLVCMGTNAERPAEEDDLCAAYIESLLRDRPFDMQEKIEALRMGGGSKFFDSSLGEVFPERDFALCTCVDRFDFVLRSVKKDGLLRIEPIPIVLYS